MRITLSSALLGSRLSTLCKVQNSKNTMPILDCILFEVKDGKLYLTASDRENEMRAVLTPDEADQEGRFAIVSKTIVDAVKDLPEQPITLEVDMETYNVKLVFQNGDYTFTAQNADEFPLSQTVGEEAKKLEIPENLLADNLARTLFATANDEVRPVMNGVFFDLMSEGLFIVATDGHKLVRNRLDSIKSEERTSFILPKKPASLLKNILGHGEEPVELLFDGSTAQIKAAFGTMVCRLTEGRYPNYASVIPQDNPFRMTVDRRALLGSVKRVLPFASESSQLIRLRLEPGMVEVSSEDIDFATSAKESTVCDYQGQPMSIGFKGPSLVEVLNNLTGDEVSVELADPSRPCIILPSEQPEGQNILMLIMPMLLND